MKRIIILVLCLLVCFGFYSVEASASAFPYTKDNIECKVGASYTGSIEVVLASENDDSKLIGQKSVKYGGSVPNDEFNLDKQALTIDVIKTFFASKPLPTGLDVVNFWFNSPLIVDDSVADEYFGISLIIGISGVVDPNFDVTGYENDLIELSIPKQYLLNYQKDTPLTLYTKHSTGVYKITCDKYEVTFDMQGHGSQIDVQKVQANFKATRPSDPSDDGYTFINWYKEPACENVYDFDTELVTSDITLYAKWEEVIIPYVPPVIEPVYEIPNTGIE